MKFVTLANKKKTREFKGGAKAFYKYLTIIRQNKYD